MYFNTPNLLVAAVRVYHMLISIQKDGEGRGERDRAHQAKVPGLSLPAKKLKQDGQVWIAFPNSGN